MDNPYQSPNANLDKEPVDVEYAGFWRRYFASVIDTLWIMPLIMLLGYLFYGTDYFYSTNLYQGPADILFQYVLPIVLVLSFWIYKSATPGKMALKVKIVDAATLQPPSKGQLIIRYFSYYISLLPIFLGFIWAAFDPKKQGWHDKIAKTLVIRT